MMIKKYISFDSWPLAIRWAFIIFGSIFIISIMVFIIHLPASFSFSRRVSKFDIFLILIGYSSVVATIRLIVHTLRERNSWRGIIFSTLYLTMELWLLYYIYEYTGDLPVGRIEDTFGQIATIATAATGFITAMTGVIGQYTLRKKLLSDIEIEKQRLKLEREKLLFEKEKLKMTAPKKRMR